MPPLLGSVNNLAVFPPTRIARFAEIGVYRVRNRLVQGLLVIGTYIHYRYVRVGSSGISTAGDCTYRDIPEYCEIVDGSRVLV
jgi:hypothetical protein